MSKWGEFYLTLFLGIFGVHKFRKGKISVGLVYFLTFGVYFIGWIYDSVIAYKEAKHESDYIKTMELNKDKERINREILYEKYRKDGLQPIEMSNLILLPGEECYYVEELLLVGKLSQSNTKVVFYITNKRLVFNFIDSLIDRDISEITYIGDVDIFNRVICIQFGKEGYNLKSPYSDLIKSILNKVIELQEEKENIICTYCGEKNNNENSKCLNCGAPLKRK